MPVLARAPGSTGVSTMLQKPHVSHLLHGLTMRLPRSRGAVNGRTWDEPATFNSAALTEFEREPSQNDGGRAAIRTSGHGQAHRGSRRSGRRRRRAHPGPYPPPPLAISNYLATERPRAFAGCARAAHDAGSIGAQSRRFVDDDLWFHLLHRGNASRVAGSRATASPAFAASSRPALPPGRRDAFTFGFLP